VCSSDLSIEIVMYSNTKDGELSYGGRIQLNDANAIRYDVTPDSFKVAAKVLGVNRTQLEFVRDDDEVLGYLYSYNGVGSVGITIRSLLHVDDEFTTIIGETGDFIL